MRRAVGMGILVLVGAVALPITTATPVTAVTPPTLALTSSTTSGGPGTPVTYTYTWNSTDCPQTGGPFTIVVYWDNPNPNEQIGSVAADPATCSGSVSGAVPTDTTRGDSHFATASLQDPNGIAFTNSGATSTNAFVVTPAPTPTPTPPPTPTPTPRPTPPPTPPPTQRPTPFPTFTQGPTPKPTPKPTPTPTPLPTPPAFIGGGGGGGTGGGPPQGGAACSGGIGRTPTPDELSSAVARLVSGADPTAIQIDVLASSEYYRDVGGVPLNFVNRLYNDVLRRDPTPVEVAIALTNLAGSGDAGRLQLVRDVIFSAEARAIRVDNGFHTLLSRYPTSSELAHWVNALATSDISSGLSGNTLIEQIAASEPYYTLAGSNANAFVSKLYQDLLSRAPNSTELHADATLIAKITAGVPSARLALAQQVVTSSEFLPQQVTSFYENYLHRTCPELTAQECSAGSLGTPTADQVATALTGVVVSSWEENVIAGVLGSDIYYQNHGATESGLVKGVYQELLGRAPTDAEVGAALQQFPDDPVGHNRFAQSMVTSSEYRDLLISQDYHQLVMRAPLAAELLTGEGWLTGSVPSLDTADQTLVEQIVQTPEYWADAGGTDSTFVTNTVGTLLVQRPTPAESVVYLGLWPLHDANWQGKVARQIVISTPYETDFVRGVYEKFLTYTVCPSKDSGVPGKPGGDGFIKTIPGGWLGLGAIALVLLLGAGAIAFLTLERRRFSPIYPDELPRPQA